MPEAYFTKLPVFNYANTKCRNIIRRGFLQPNTIAQSIQFYPYEVDSGLRADVLSAAYYQDTYMDWLIYLTNGIQDPYYDWYLSENDFERFIVKKYGSFEESQRRIKHYELNWSDDDAEISPSFYTDVLSEPLKKYYTPHFGQGSRIISYRRRKEEWVVNTNKILTIDISVVGNTQFVNNELVDIKDGGAFVGRAEIMYANDVTLIVHNISGNTSSNTAYIIGLTTSANATLLDTNILDTTIPDDEYVYWTPVSLYDWERARNEDNKSIYLLDASRSFAVSEQIRKALKDPVVK